MSIRPFWTERRLPRRVHWGGTPVDEVIEMMDTTDEIPPSGGAAASSSAAAPAAASPMEVQRASERAAPASEPTSKRARRTAVAAIVNQVLSNYSTQDPEELELDQVLGEGGVVLERSAESLREGRMSEINKFHEKGVAKKTGAKVFAARWQDGWTTSPR